MKNVIVPVLLALSSTPVSAQWGIGEIPSLEQQMEHVKNDEFDKVVSTVESEDYFAGKLVEINLYGRQRVVDRRSEPMRPSKGGGKDLEALNSVLNGIGAEGRGSLEIDVTREWHENGELKLEKWKIKAGYQVAIEKKVDTKPPKATGEDGKGPE